MNWSAFPGATIDHTKRTWAGNIAACVFICFPDLHKHLYILNAQELPPSVPKSISFGIEVLVRQAA